MLHRVLARTSRTCSSSSPYFTVLFPRGIQLVVHAVYITPGKDYFLDDCRIIDLDPTVLDPTPCQTSETQHRRSRYRKNKLRSRQFTHLYSHLLLWTVSDFLYSACKSVVCSLKSAFYTESAVRSLKSAFYTESAVRSLKSAFYTESAVRSLKSAFYTESAVRSLHFISQTTMNIISRFYFISSEPCMSLKCNEASV